MAFVSRAERKLHMANDQSIGPGAYINPSHYASNPSFAPFTSTSERNLNKLFGNTSTPGPGTYTGAVENPHNKSLDHWGNTKYSAPFASQKQRFNYSTASYSPGPGTYSVTDKWKIKKNEKVPQPSFNYPRIPSAPSIPAHHQTFGYDEGPSGEMILQKNPDKVYSGNPNDSIGPGHYSFSEKKKTKGPSWQKSKLKREVFQGTTTGPEIGPGSYNDSKLNIAPMYKFKENAVFASKVHESEIEFKNNDSPGPGSYSVEKFGAFAKVVKKKPRSLQNFGSSSLRFKKKVPEYDTGPGYYNDSSTAISKSSSNAKIPFTSGDTRFNYSKSFTPGPGAYRSSDLIENLNKKVWGKQGVFGSSEKRFPRKSTALTPGPAYYPPDAYKRIGSHTSMAKKQHAVFMSKSNRREMAHHSDIPPPGAYEIQSKIGQSRPPASSMHPVLSRVTKTQSEKNLGFASRSGRFSTANCEKTPGPGSYDYKNGGNNKKIMVSKEDRFKKYKKHAEVPGPGTYSEETHEWTKKSYNVLFSDNN